jgi:fatty acid desaturase
MGKLLAAERKGAAATANEHRRFYQTAREICGDLFSVRSTVYWVDFVLSASIAYVLASVYLAMPVTSMLAWAAFFGAAVFLYRASMFIHEIVHLSTGEMKFFRRFWNFFAGVPMMVPSFTYESHLHHHSSRHYGTDNDGEYLPLASGTIGGVFVFLMQVFFQPLLVVIRYAIWTPISFCNMGLRKWTLQHATSLVINFQYENHKRPEKQSAEDTFWELFTAFRVYVMFGLVFLGTMPIERLPRIYLLAVFVLVLNHVRTLAAHRYTSDGSTISHLDQFLDSTNITGNWLTELMCPLGLRYHALHHLFPKIPYYNLGVAHRRLIRDLPKDSLYHETVYPDMKSAISELLESVRKNSLVGCRPVPRDVEEEGLSGRKS